LEFFELFNGENGMFSGLVESIGHITQLEPLGQPQGLDVQGSANGVRLRVHAPNLDLANISLGDSIAIQGACMTVVALWAEGFAVDVSQESLSKTVGLNTLGPVNLEQAMRMGDRIGGHLVSGHVDGLGEVVQFAAVGESWHLQVLVPAILSPCLAYKGSVAINGVSLTVNQVDDHTNGSCTIHINLIPHTLAHTTLQHLQVGVMVNVEVDQLARYCERICDHMIARRTSALKKPCTKANHALTPTGKIRSLKS
jgi:riboflavin synthase